MKRLIILSLVMLFLGMFPLTANAKENISLKTVDTLRVGLKKISKEKLTLTTKGGYLLNGIKIESGEKLEFSLNKSKINFRGNNYDAITIKPQDNDNRIIINYGKHEHLFNGSFEIRNSKGKILPINIVSVEDYVEGVLPYEMSSEYPLEALKAQAVSARNYALTSLNKHRNEKFDVCDGVHCQVYKGNRKNCDKIETAVRETKGEILTHEGNIVKAFFYASNGGYTESSKNVWKSDYSYLVSKKDEYDTYKWDSKRPFTSLEIEGFLKKRGYLSHNDKFKGIGKITTNSSGRNSEVEILYKQNGQNKVKHLLGEQPRIAFSLKSSMFDIDYNAHNDTYTFKGKGYGHGVGMSQYGARKRAEQGQNYRSILNFYYQGSKLQKIK